MQWGNLGAAWWSLLAAAIVLLYLLRVRVRRQPVSTSMFWSQVIEPGRPRFAWGPLRQIGSLLAQLLLLALLVAALLDPSLGGPRQEPRRVVLVVDQSASMQARDAGPSRIELARREGRRLIHGLRPDDELAIIAAGSTTRVLCGLTSYEPELRRAVEGIQATDGPGRMGDAVELSRKIVDQQPEARIVVVTDGCLAEHDVLSGEDLEVVLVGEPLDNVGITRFQPRRLPQDPLSYEVLVEVRNAGRRPVELRLELELNGNLVDVQPLRLEPRQVWSRVLTQTSATGGRLIARLRPQPTRSPPAGSDAAEASDGSGTADSSDSPARIAAANRRAESDQRAWSDALAADDLAEAMLPDRARQSVLLVTDGNLYLERVLAAIPAVDLTVTDQLPATVPAGTVVVYHRLVPAVLPAGNILVIDPRDASDRWQLGPSLPPPVLVDPASESPLLSHVRLAEGQVIVTDARPLEMTVDHQVLARAVGGGPIYVSAESPNGRLLVLSVNLSQGDLPLRTAFPILVSNAIHWLQGAADEPLPSLAEGGAAPRDGDLLPAEIVTRTAPAAAARSAGISRPLWWELTLLALVLLCLEWFLYQRRWIA
ncbi:MAG: VWA domain-containing protein [Pirellulaceae bacterium]|nr:VWA domain-containing protein [Pirellulaceae bacterium]